jgi:predicted O-methyltransferase YrrM
MFSGTGQINMNSVFGNEIYKLCKRDNIRNIFEVGTWNGEGSTICVMNAIIEKYNNSILYSIEADSIQYSKAVNYWNNKDSKDKLVLLKGVLHNECFI